MENSTVKSYRKRPVTIKAIRLDKENIDLVGAWSGGLTRYEPGGEPDGITVPTLHGPTHAKFGDWVAQGPTDFYPIDAATFAATYDVVSEFDPDDLPF